MTKDDITKLARQAEGTPYVNRHYPGVTSFGFNETTLLAFAELVAAAEPPQREWQGLTDNDWVAIDNKKGTALDTFTQGAVWAESQLRKRNT